MHIKYDIWNQFINFKKDILIICLIILISCGTQLAIISIYGDEIVMRSIGGRWFQSDGWRVFDDMVDFGANHHRNSLRPLFSLLTMPWVLLIKSIFVITPIQAIWIFNSICLALWCLILYSICRVLGMPIGACALTTIIGSTSGAAVFWFIVPETYPLSSIFLLLCLLISAIQVRRELKNWVLILVGFLVAGTLITNWSACLIMNFVFKKTKEAFFISLITLVLFFVGWGIQKIIFPFPGGFPAKHIVGERNYMLHEDQGNLACKLTGGLISPILVPAIYEIQKGIEATGKRLSIQCSGIFNSGSIYVLASSAWLMFLGFGIVITLRTKTKQLKKFKIFLFGTLLSQLTLHLIYGEETFLYSLHFAPLLALLAGNSLTSKNNRPYYLCATLFLIVSMGNNYHKVVLALSTPNTGMADERIVTRIKSYGSKFNNR